MVVWENAVLLLGGLAVGLRRGGGRARSAMGAAGGERALGDAGGAVGHDCGRRVWWPAGWRRARRCGPRSCRRCAATSVGRRGNCVDFEPYVGFGATLRVFGWLRRGRLTLSSFNCSTFMVQLAMRNTLLLFAAIALTVLCWGTVRPSAADGPGGHVDRRPARWRGCGRSCASAWRTF